MTLDDIVKKSTLNHPEEDRVKLKQEAIKNRPVEDFLQLARNRHFANIMDKMKDYTDPSCIYTDHVCRINRWGTRKVKLIAVTGNILLSRQILLPARTRRKQRRQLQNQDVDIPSLHQECGASSG